MTDIIKRSPGSRMHLLIGVLLLCMSGFVLSCTQTRQPCLTPKIASLNLECLHYLNDSTPPLDTALPKAIFVALTDSTGPHVVLYTTASALFTLSLSSTADSCRWAMAADSAVVANNPAINEFDTLSFFYRRKLQFLSNACGYAYFYSLDSVHYTHVNIDSIIIANTSVTNNVNLEHLKIYIHHN